MKWFIVGAGILGIAGAILIASAKRRDKRPSDVIDGGVRHYNSGEDAPKVIESTDVTEFCMTYSLFALGDTGDLAKGMYSFKAKISDGKVGCEMKWRDRFGNGDSRSFVADGSFMKKLHEIVIKHDLAQHNGYSCSVSGLPDMYGAYLNVSYASSESIYAYNNQHVFLTLDAMKAVFDLFNEWK